VTGGIFTQRTAHTAFPHLRARRHLPLAHWPLHTRSITAPHTAHFAFALHAGALRLASKNGKRIMRQNPRGAVIKSDLWREWSVAGRARHLCTPRAFTRCAPSHVTHRLQVSSSACSVITYFCASAWVSFLRIWRGGRWRQIGVRRLVGRHEHRAEMERDVISDVRRDRFGQAFGRGLPRICGPSRSPCPALTPHAHTCPLLPAPLSAHRGSAVGAGRRSCCGGDRRWRTVFCSAAAANNIIRTAE